MNSSLLLLLFLFSLFDNSSPPGATGFTGAWTARAFLERGYDVRGTVRSKSKGEWLANQTWAKASSGIFEYVVVEDIQVAGAFDHAVKGVTVVVHTASPTTSDAQMDPYDLINPAVKGTMGIFDSILEHAPGVKRVVITSSTGTILGPPDTPRVYTEEDWNVYSVNDIETNGVSAEPLNKYLASKVKAEKAVWAFVEKHNGQLDFEVTTILPSFIYGPIIHDIASVENLISSPRIFYDNIRKEVSPTETSYGNYVDVRDVAEMHVDAVESDGAAGQRIIASGGCYSWQDFYDALNAHADPIPGVPVGTPGAGNNVQRQMIAYSTEKAERLLGFKFRSLEETSYDTLVSFKERGFW